MLSKVLSLNTKVKDYFFSPLVCVLMLFLAELKQVKEADEKVRYDQLDLTLSGLTAIRKSKTSWDASKMVRATFNLRRDDILKCAFKPRNVAKNSKMYVYSLNNVVPSLTN